MAKSVTVTITSQMVGTGLVVPYNHQQGLQMRGRALVSALFALISGLWAIPSWAAVAGSPPAAAIAAGYPVDTSPPKDFFDDRLLRTLAREASATVVCTLIGLVDIFPEQKDPDVFYDATCEILKVISGSPKGKPFHFIWQVERGSRMPPPQSPLLVYLKARKGPFDGPPPLKWVALDTGVLRYTSALEKNIGRASKHLGH